MGDRSNVEIKQGAGEGSIFLYAHWSGLEVLKSVAHGVTSGRAHDTAYLGRVIFSHMVRGEEDDETGYGISTYRVGDEHNLTSVDPAAGTVTFGETTVNYSKFANAVKQYFDGPGTEDDEVSEDEYFESLLKQ